MYLRALRGELQLLNCLCVELLMLNQFWNRFGEQKLDILSYSAQDHDPMKSIGEEGILLNV